MLLLLVNHKSIYILSEHVKLKNMNVIQFNIKLYIKKNQIPYFKLKITKQN